MFLTELPADQYGNRPMVPGPPQVIEVEPYTDEDGDMWWRVLAPQSFAKVWPDLAPHNRWVEVEGPARSMDEQEYVAVLESAGVAERYLERARFRANASI